ncbi:MAG: Hsp70 family protein, partial [Clostridia bacterium]
KAVKDAEKYAEEDKKRKEEVEVKNGLDQLLLSIETFIRESGDKLEPADKTQLEEDVKKGKEVLEKGTSEEIKAETDRIAKSNAEIFQRFYQKNAPKQEEGAGEQPKHEDAPHDDDIKDA